MGRKFSPASLLADTGIMFDLGCRGQPEPLLGKEIAMKTLMVLFALSAAAMVGCDKNKGHDDMNSSSPKKMSTDACSHCAGDQMATADGKCPACGMKVK
jgi:hypothetical protein